MPTRRLVTHDLLQTKTACSANHEVCDHAVHLSRISIGAPRNSEVLGRIVSQAMAPLLTLITGQQDRQTPEMTGMQRGMPDSAAMRSAASWQKYILQLKPMRSHAGRGDTKSERASFLLSTRRPTSPAVFALRAGREKKRPKIGGISKQQKKRYGCHPTPSTAFDPTRQDPIQCWKSPHL